MRIHESLRDRRVGLFTLAVLGLLIGLGTSTAAADGVPKRVACQLPFVQGHSNLFCSDLHKILFLFDGYDPNKDKIVAELLAMDEQGNVLKSIPVHAGDLARLTSNTKPSALKVSQTNNLFTVTAPIPVLHVTADDGVTKSEAFCSNIPFIQTLQPNDAVISVSDPKDDVTHVLAAIPLADPAHLAVQVDGVDIFAAFGIGNPAATCTPASPCDRGPVTIHGNAVTLKNLVIDSRPIDHYAANTVSFDIAGLGCGGHAFTIESQPRPGSRTKFLVPSCHDDPLNAKTLSSGFGIIVDKPADQETGLTFPVEVKGQICSGNRISVLSLNGNENFDITTQTCQKGDPTDPKACTDDSTSADTWTFDFDFAVNKTDVGADVTTGTAPLGTFDPGSNRLIVGATDDQGNRTLLTRFFGTGTTLNTGLSLSVQPQIQDLIKEAVDQAALFPTTVDVPNAFVIGLSPAAIQQQITQRCTEPKSVKNPTGGAGQIFRDKVLQALAPNGFPALVNIPLCKAPDPPCGTTTTITISPDCSLSVDTHVWITAIDLDPDDITCPVDFEDHVIHSTINLPSITLHIEVGADGMGTASVNETDVCICDPFDPSSCACTCALGTTIHATTSVTMSGLNFKFDITEDQLLNGTMAPAPPCPDPGKASGGGCFNPGTTSDPNDNLDKDGSGLCGVAVVCEFFAVVLDFLSFGALDLGGIDIALDPDFTTAVGNAEPDPIKLHSMNIDPEPVKGHNQTLGGTLSSVSINSSGLLAGLKGTFATTQVDSEVQPTPGALITQPPLPTLPVPGGQDALIAVSTDTLNMLNAGMTVGGALKTTCKPQTNPDTSPKTLGDLLPHSPTGCQVGDPGCDVACDTLPCDNCSPFVLAAEQGVCHGINLDSCESLSVADPDPNKAALLTAIKQGACHGTRGDNCNAIAVSSKLAPRLAERATCHATPNLNLNKNQHLLFCTRQDIPPTLLPLSGGGATAVNSVLRLKALSVGMVLDRDSAGSLDTSLADTPQCGPNARTGQCSLFEACLDVNANFDLQFVPTSEATCSGETGIKNIFKQVQVKLLPGVLCSVNGQGTTDSDVVDQSNKTKVVEQDLPAAAQAAAPPICMKGFDLGGFVTCSTPQLVTIETDGDSTSRDWLGVTCAITAGP